MFPRVTHPSATPVLLRAFDLHVLSLPPAFVLSQDQTLKFNLKDIPTGHNTTHPTGGDAPLLLTSSKHIRPQAQRPSARLTAIQKSKPDYAMILKRDRRLSLD